MSYRLIRMISLSPRPPPPLSSPQDYIMDNVLQSDDDEDENEPTSEEEALQMAERLNDRRVLLASFLKMAMFSIIDNKLIAPIWAQYIRVSV